MSGDRPRAMMSTNAQERRRRLAFRLDGIDTPGWVDRALCVAVGWGHTPIHSYGGAQCAWCNAPTPDDAPDTIPQDWWRRRNTRGEVSP